MDGGCGEYAATVARTVPYGIRSAVTVNVHIYSRTICGKIYEGTLRDLVFQHQWPTGELTPFGVTLIAQMLQRFLNSLLYGISSTVAANV